MSDLHLPRDERLLQLLADRATEGLDPGDERELELLARAEPDADLDALDLAAAELAAAWLSELPGSAAEVPAELHERLSRDAEAFFADAPALQVHSGAAPGPRQRAADRGLWAAAAVFLAFMGLVLLLGRPQSEGGASPIALRKRVSALPDAIELPWAKPEDPRYAQVSGDVVWSDAAQAGVLRLRGLPSNDPRRAQYQLWIVDPDVDEHPVDGGVFDVPAGQGEVLIPIDAKLSVEQPAAFAITLERPGGVVVSAGPLLVVAAR
ncbi:MAG TPA: hypothetical protein DEA08_11665 [Planctomycetes bacterium]|nr:hypothetical protein [Planctomycetota bacterium]